MGRLAHVHRIASLDRRIELQTYTATRSNTGQELLTWSCLARVWAEVKYQLTKSDEGIEADQLVATTRAVFTIRHRCGIEPKHRIVHDGKTWNILVVREHNNARARFLQLESELMI